MGHEGSELGPGAKRDAGVGDFNRDGAGLTWEGCKLQLRATDILARQGPVTRGAQNARGGDSKIPKETKPGTRMGVPQAGDMKSGQDWEKDR